MLISQLQASYQARQDRILLRMNTQSSEEFRLWLTRRMVKSFLPHLVQVSAQLDRQTVQLVSHDGTSRDALSAFKKQESLALADFKTPYKAQALTLPMGREPLLVTTVHITPLDQQNLRLGFEEQADSGDQPRAFEITLGSVLLHSLLHLLELALTNADWGIVVKDDPQPADSQVPEEWAAAKPPAYLH